MGEEDFLCGAKRLGIDRRSRFSAVREARFARRREDVNLEPAVVFFKENIVCAASGFVFAQFAMGDPCVVDRRVVMFLRGGAGNFDGLILRNVGILDGERAIRGGFLKRGHGRVQFGVFFKLLGDGQRGAEFVQPVPVIRAAVEHGLQLLRAPGGSAQIAVLQAGLVHAVARPDGAGIAAPIDGDGIRAGPVRIHKHAVGGVKLDDGDAVFLACLYAEHGEHFSRQAVFFCKRLTRFFYG